ncbi:MAG TPA: hypothetical protein VFY07_01535 [Geomobilimonas sp.]|nr:hypothetical protein [Geomobilimonas sp.]
MAHTLLHKFVTLLLLAVVISASVVGLCRETHAVEQRWDGHGGQDTAACQLAGEDGHCPSCPADEHTGDDCASSCYCSCHLPLTSQFGLSVHTPLVSTLVPFDSFFHFPEVYLPKFIPPQIHA